MPIQREIVVGKNSITEKNHHTTKDSITFQPLIYTIYHHHWTVVYVRKRLWIHEWHCFYKPENHHSNGRRIVNPSGGGGGKLVWPVLRVALNLEKSTLWRAIRNFPRNYSRHYCSEDSSREQTEVLNWLANKNSFKVPFCLANGYYRRLVTITPKG